MGWKTGGDDATMAGVSNEARYLSIVSGRSRGIGACAARAGLLALEPLYRGIIRTRNTLFDTKIKPAHDLGRPTVSVGNITTGGTGKTPVVQWLAAEWLARGGRPAVLLRGYHAHDGLSDEAELLRAPGVEVEANPDRVAGAANVLTRAPQTDLFILDDGFQHRRAKRDLDIVLIDATNPFGHGHVLPRGLLREPVSSLARADVIVITRSGAIGDAVIELRTQIRQHAPRAEILTSDHVLAGLVDAADKPVAWDAAGRCAVVAGIGNPEAFAESLRARGIDIAAAWSPGDHHVYTDADVQRLRGWVSASSRSPGTPGEGRGEGASRALTPTLSHGYMGEGEKRVDSIITTEKDWVKLRHLPNVSQLRVLRAALRIDFADGDADRLMGIVSSRAKK